MIILIKILIGIIVLLSTLGIYLKCRDLYREQMKKGDSKDPHDVFYH